MKNDTLNDEKTCSSIFEFIREIALHPHFPCVSYMSWIYRGQADISWPLRPKAGRPEYAAEGDLLQAFPGHIPLDIQRFNEWKHQAVAYCGSLPDSDIECMALAQHYGLATRLLDWTSNPLAALYFAVEANANADGVVYAMLPVAAIENVADFRMGEWHKIAIYRPRPLDRRILAQGGLFTYHPNPYMHLEAGPIDLSPIAIDGVNLVAIRIPAAAKKNVQFHLHQLGIGRNTLFPDLEGLSAYINWGTKIQPKTVRTSYGEFRL